MIKTICSRYTVDGSQFKVNGKKKKERKNTVYHLPSTVYRHGQILVVGLIFIAVVLILTTSLFGRTADLLRFGSRSITSEQANGLAEAGLERAFWQLNQTAGSYTGETNTALGTTGTFTVTVQDKSSNLKTITATGYVPNATNQKSMRVIKVDVGINNQIIAFNYAVQVGVGGITMNNSSTIKGTAYSNKTGVSIQGYNSSQIQGDAYAVGTISTPDPIVTGTKHQNQSPSVFPTLDYQYWRDSAEAGGVINCPGGTCNYSGSGTMNLGPARLNGNLVVSNSKIINMQGPIYVTGDVSVSNSAKIKLDNSFGSNGSILITDKTVTVSNSGGFDPTTATPKGYVLVASTSTNNNALSVANQGVNAIFYALDGGAQMSNAAKVTELVAKSLIMSNSATLEYDSGLASAQFSTGPGGSWQIIKGTYKYSN